jgi:hypothetical protein
MRWCIANVLIVLDAPVRASLLFLRTQLRRRQEGEEAQDGDQELPVRWTSCARSLYLSPSAPMRSGPAARLALLPRLTRHGMPPPQLPGSPCPSI